MPVDQALLAGTEGAAFGFFPIMWIVVNAIWVYNLTVATGHFDVLRRSFEKVSPDQRIQAIIIAFCFGALLEALAGFGTPVADHRRHADGARASSRSRPRRSPWSPTPPRSPSVRSPRRSSPWPRSPSGASDDPGLNVDTLGAMVGRQTPLLAVVVPLILVLVVDGRRGARQTWLPALVCGVVVRLRPVRRRQLHLRAARRHRRGAGRRGRGRCSLLRGWSPAETLEAEPPTGRGATAWQRRPAAGGSPAGGVATAPPRTGRRHPRRRGCRPTRRTP